MRWSRGAAGEVRVVMVIVIVMFRVKVIVAPAVVRLLLYMMLDLAPIPFQVKEAP